MSMVCFIIQRVLGKKMPFFSYQKLHFFPLILFMRFGMEALSNAWRLMKWDTIK